MGIIEFIFMIMLSEIEERDAIIARQQKDLKVLSGYCGVQLPMETPPDYKFLGCPLEVLPDGTSRSTCD